ncbi:MAG: hypothetical protein ABSG25_09675 [Bryobacteraceae bacterium]
MKFKIGDKVLVDGDFYEIIDTCVMLNKFGYILLHLSGGIGLTIYDENLMVSDKYTKLRLLNE